MCSFELNNILQFTFRRMLLRANETRTGEWTSQQSSATNAIFSLTRGNIHFEQLLVVVKSRVKFSQIGEVAIRQSAGLRKALLRK